MKFEVLPTSDVSLRSSDSKRELPDQEELNRQLQEAARAAGNDDVEAALAQVKSGDATPEALLDWMDDLRDPEERNEDIDPAEVQEGFVPDFIADTEMAGGSLDLKDPTNEAKDAMFFVAAAKQSGEVGAVDSDADADYFLSVLKKRRGDPDDSDEGGGDENAPQQKKTETKLKVASKKRSR